MPSSFIDEAELTRAAYNDLNVDDVFSANGRNYIVVGYEIGRFEGGAFDFV